MDVISRLCDVLRMSGARKKLVVSQEFAHVKAVILSGRFRGISLTMHSIETIGGMDPSSFFFLVVPGGLELVPGRRTQCYPWRGIAVFQTGRINNATAK